MKLCNKLHSFNVFQEINFIRELKRSMAQAGQFSSTQMKYGVHLFLEQKFRAVSSAF